jgi:acyl dehydratase
VNQSQHFIGLQLPWRRATIAFQQPWTTSVGIAVGLTAGAINPHAMSYGYEPPRFVKPVFLGDTIHLEVSAKEKRDDPKRPAHGIVVESCHALNQRGETVLACEHLLLVERKTVA